VEIGSFFAELQVREETKNPWDHMGIYMGLFKVIFYFPNGKSTTWGIYSEYFFHFLGTPNQQIQV